jgi:hypothetical protein
MKKSLAMKQLALALGSAAVLSAGMVTSAYAVPFAPITGKISIGFQAVSVSAGEADFNPALDPGVQGAGGSYGDLFTSAVSTRTGSWLDAAFNVQTDGDIGDLSNNPADGNYTPVGAQIPPRPAYLKFDVKPTWRFFLTYLAPGTEAGTPYSLTEFAGSTFVSMDLHGYACVSTDADCDDVGSDSDKTPWNLAISTQYAGQTAAALRAVILGGGTLDNNTWSGSLVMPEPGTLALIGISAIGLAGFGRRAANRAAQLG